eukprot:295284_1
MASKRELTQEGWAPEPLPCSDSEPKSKPQQHHSVPCMPTQIRLPIANDVKFLAPPLPPDWLSSFNAGYDQITMSRRCITVTLLILCVSIGFGTAEAAEAKSTNCVTQRDSCYVYGRGIDTRIVM